MLYAHNIHIFPTQNIIAQVEVMPIKRSNPNVPKYINLKTKFYVITTTIDTGNSHKSM